MTYSVPRAVIDAMDGLLTSRQIDYWRRKGVLGNRTSGSGNHDTYSDHEIAKLHAIGRVAQDAKRLGWPMSLRLVGQLWSALDAHPVITVSYGTISIHAELEAPA